MKKFKICTLLLVVILNLIFISSCGYQPIKAYESGHIEDYGSTAGPHHLHVKSDTNIFDIDEVILETYICVRAVKYYHEGNTYEYFDYDQTIPIYTNGIITPVTININYVSFEYILNEEKNNYDLKILNEGTLKNLDPEDVLDGKYEETYTDDYKRIIYKYSEILTIPKECFNRDSGEFCIGTKVNNKYQILIYFSYKMIDENTVQIQFDYEKFKWQANSSTSSESIHHIKKYYNEKEEIEK